MIQLSLLTQKVKALSEPKPMQQDWSIQSMALVRVDDDDGVPVHVYLFVLHDENKSKTPSKWKGVTSLPS